MNKEDLEAILCSVFDCVDAQCYAADVVVATSCQILCCFSDLASRIQLNLVRVQTRKARLLDLFYPYDVCSKISVICLNKVILA